MASAFKMIMSKKIAEDNSDDQKDAKTKSAKSSEEDEPDVILAKYKKKARDIDAQKAEDEKEKKK